MRRWLLVILSAALLTGCATSAKREAALKVVDSEYKYGKASFLERKYPDAAAHFRAALEVDPESTKVLYALAHVYYAQGDYRETEDVVKRIVLVDPEHGDGTNLLGMTYGKQGRHREAIETFARAADLRDFRSPHFALHNKGIEHLFLGETALAEESFHAAIRRVPEYYPARADLAKLYIDSGRWAEAAEQWRTFLDLAPDLHEGHYFLGRAYIGLGKSVLAAKELDDFLAKVDSTHPLVPEAQALLDDLSPGR